MTIALLYVFPTINRPVYDPLARRFVSTYLQHPPGTNAHQIYVVVNGMSYRGMEAIFNPLSVQFLPHTNMGKDIGAYQMAASRIKADMLVCLGAPVHFHKPGWLDWMVDSYIKNGPGLYGAWGFHQPSPHIRTTAFWLPSELLNAYPYIIGDYQRYGFEHGPNSITLWCQRIGFQTLQVTWEGVFDTPNWHHVGVDQSLFLDQHTH